ncbi:MAG: KamA family radical SAM protein [Phycisphaerales bacterium JB039]
MHSEQRHSRLRPSGDPRRNGDASAEVRYRAITRANVESLAPWRALEPEIQQAIRIISLVLPFRTNPYVMEELIDWDRVPDDPIFQLTFPQRGMLADEQYRTLERLLDRDADRSEIDEAVRRIRLQLNPHPAGQTTQNVPSLDGVDLPGMQHKYRETVLFFPGAGQTCHAYCTFCFRWAQFVDLENMKFAARDVELLAAYLRRHGEVTDVLITGGDPMVMNSRVLRRYVEPLLEIDSVTSIRFGTKAPAYWPQRFVTDPDADELLRLFEQIRASGKNVALMGHFTHPMELSTDIAQAAVRRIIGAGAVMRIQSPVVRHINDRPGAWRDLWRRAVQLGAVPYYMFVERDTGARNYFELPLVRCWRIFRDAYRQVSGLARTVRGPSMSCFPGKCHVLGVTEAGREKAFVLQFLQARDPELVRRPFFAKYDPEATWYDQLQPLTANDRPFFPDLGMDQRLTQLTCGMN